MTVTHVDSKPSKSATPLWRKIIAWILGTLVALSLTLILTLTSALWWLQPERLTPLVNSFLSNYLEADVKSERVELTFWSTFPHIELAVDSLEIVSRRFDRLTPEMRAQLPVDADSLLSVASFSGGIHLLKVATGAIDLYDIRLSNPRVNLVIAPDSTTNFDIVPPSEPSTEPTVIPEISIDHFAILGNFPIRYRATGDSIDVTLNMSASELRGEEAPQYTLSLGGGANTNIPGLHIPEIPFSLNGRIVWNQKQADIVGLKDFRFEAIGNRVDFNAVLSLADPLTLQEFDATVPEIYPADILKIFAPGHELLRPLDTDLRVRLTAKLLKPYSPTQSELPRVQIDLDATASEVQYDVLNLTDFEAKVSALVDDADLDRSTVDIRHLHASGRAIDVTITVSLSRLLSDPDIHGTFKGAVALGRLPSALTSRLPINVKGTLSGDASYALRMSMLTPKQLHRVRLDGQLDLKEFYASTLNPSDSTEAYVRHARLDLGTSSRVGSGDHMIDSMFTASLTVDTVVLRAPGVKVRSGNLQAKLGSRNVASSTDTTRINPFGGSVSIGNFTLMADSSNTRIRLRDIRAGGALMRYNNEARAPRIEMGLHAGRMSLRNNSIRTSVRELDASLSFHPRARRPMPPAVQSRYDSLAALYPTLSSDSLRVLARRELRKHRSHTADTEGRENIDFNIDNSLSSWLRLWQLSGSIKAKRARLYTPHFPIRNRLSDLDFDFSTDSVFIRNTRFESGHSDFLINGSIRNIANALTSRGRRPLEIDLDVMSDTIDINEFSATILRGSAYTHSAQGQHSTLAEIVDEELDEAEDYVDITVDEPPVKAILVPSNIHADLRMRASTVLYTDLTLHNFEGHVGVFDGAVDLDRFTADADIGSLELTALYSAPTIRDIQFAAGLKLHRLQLAQALKFMPQIDSLMPMLSGISGIVDASVALTTSLDSAMNVNLPTTDVAVRLTGDSLVLLDTETFKTVAKWMLFKNKKRNMIDHMDVEIMVHDGAVNLYPVIFEMDRYKLGVVGSNDLALNLDYHVAVLRSPLPFRFGINIKGTPEKLKIRLGKARVDEKKVAQHQPFADNIRVNLLSEMHNLFRRGVKASGMHGLRSTLQRSDTPANGQTTDDGSSTEATLEFIRQGLVNLDSTRRTIDPARQKKLKKAGRTGKRLAK